LKQGHALPNQRGIMKKRLAAALTISALSLAGCYVVPIAPDGSPMWPVPMAVPPGPGAPLAQPALPAVLTARLYPANDLATQTGVLQGTVTNMMSGKGRFQLSYRGEVLTGEATRISGDDRRGIATAYGTGGSYMSCEYQMHTPYQGAGTCTFSNGARYQVHIGNGTRS
jgi:hypothetical protein